MAFFPKATLHNTLLPFLHFSAFFPLGSCHYKGKVIPKFYPPSLIHSCILTLHTHTQTHTHLYICETGTLVFSIELDEHLQKGVNIFTSYINELRTFLIKFPWKLTDAVDEYDVKENVPKVKESNIWEELSVEVNMSNCHFFYLPDSEDLKKHRRNRI